MIENHVGSEDLGLREIILNVQKYIRYLIKNGLWILLGGLLIGLCMFLYSQSKDVTYVSQLTFVVNEESDSPSFNIPSSLSAFGLSGGSNSSINLNKIVALSNSDKIRFATYLDTINNESQILINQIIKTYELEDLGPVEYLTVNDLAEMSIDEKRKLRIVTGYIHRKLPELIGIDMNEMSQILTVKSTSYDEDLSYILSTIFFKKISSFYTEQAISKAEENVMSLQTRKDSLERVLTEGEYSLASLIDKNSALVYSSSSLSKIRKQREVEMVNQMYLEVIKNLEIARYKLSTVTPTFTIVDRPYYPLSIIGKNVLKNTIIGFLLGSLIATFVLLIRKIYSEIMNTHKT